MPLTGFKVPPYVLKKSADDADIICAEKKAELKSIQKEWNEWCAFESMKVFPAKMI